MLIELCISTRFLYLILDSNHNGRVSYIILGFSGSIILLRNVNRPIGLANFICPSTGEYQGQKGGVGGQGSGGGWIWGTFGIALEM